MPARWKRGNACLAKQPVVFILFFKLPLLTLQREACSQKACDLGQGGGTLNALLAYEGFIEV